MNRIDNYVQGESLDLVFIVEEDDSVKNISGADIVWEIADAKGGDSVITQEDSGVEITIVNEEDGEFSVDIDGSVTEGLGGEQYWERVVVTDSSGNTQKWGSKLLIKED